jgi:hypothetical protein
MCRGDAHIYVGDWMYEFRTGQSNTCIVMPHLPPPTKMSEYFFVEAGCVLGPSNQEKITTYNIFKHVWIKPVADQRTVRIDAVCR